MDKKVLMSVFIITIMVVSVLGITLNYAFNNSKEGRYNKTKFKQTYNVWIGYKDDQKIQISSTPNSLESLKIPDVSFSDLVKEKTYFTTNPQDPIPMEALSDIQTNLVPKFNSLIISCIQDSAKCSNLPIKTCSDASFSTSIIQIEIRETPNVIFENNCLLIQAPYELMTSYIDAVILKLYGL